MSVSSRIQSVLPFSQFLEAAEHPCGGTTEVFLFEDPTQSGPSRSLSRSAGAVRAYGMALAASLTHKNSANVTSHIGSEGEGKTEVMIFGHLVVRPRDELWVNSRRFSEQIQMVKYCCVSCERRMPSMICCTVVLLPCFSSTERYEPSMR